MRILFITQADLATYPYGDGSTRYRCFNVAEVAKGHGCSATVMQMDQVQTADLYHYDVISWLRPEASRKFKRIINRAKQLGIRCIADVDDLIFDPALSRISPAVVNAQSTESIIRKRFVNHARALSYVDAITVSTSTLEEHVKRLFPATPVYTLHNGLSAYWLSWAEQCTPCSQSFSTIGYLPGTRSHDRDFQSICPELSQWMHGRSEARLRVVGKLSIGTGVLPNKQWSLQPWIDYFDLPSTIVSCAATLAPLENTLFNSAKSHVKFIESAALGVPLIASPNPDLAQHAVKGLHLVSTREQWSQALQTISNSGFDSEEREKLKRYVQFNCTAEVYTRPLLEAWIEGGLTPALLSRDKPLEKAA